MSEQTINTVIFDLDDVLCDYDRNARIAHMAQTTALSSDAVIAAIWDSGFDDDADEGAYSAADYLAETEMRLGHPISATQWADARKAGMTPRPVVLEMASRIQARASLAGFTNNGPLMHQMIADIFPEAHELFGDRLFFSYDIGLAKPDPKAYLAVLEIIGAKPRQTLFIDDNEGYVLGAAAAGLHVHRYIDADSLAHQLRNFGLL
jgi:glucose-1-phosphatase